MKVRAVDFVMYRVNDIERAVVFYRDVLGLPLEFESVEHQWAEFDCGNTTLALFGGSDVTSRGSAARVALSVDDIAAAWSDLMQRAVPMGGPPQDWGVCQSLEIFDPDGNAILLHHRSDGSCGNVERTVGNVPHAE